MGSFLDVFILIFLFYFLWKCYQESYVKMWFVFGYNVIGWALATLYSSALAKSQIMIAANRLLSVQIPNSNLAVSISAFEGAITPNTNLPSQLNNLIQKQVDLLKSQQDILVASIEQAVVNLLLSLTCYMLIWIAVQIVFYLANQVLLKKSFSVKEDKSILNLIPALGNALIFSMILSGIIWPFAILFDQMGLIHIWNNSIILRALASLFYLVQGWV